MVLASLENSKEFSILVVKKMQDFKKLKVYQEAYGLSKEVLSI
jgi:hypothetical protein